MKTPSTLFGQSQPINWDHSEYPKNVLSDTSLWNAAFLNTDGSKAMVVYNGTTATNTFQVQWGGQVLTYSLPAKSGVTLTWNGPQN